MTSVILLRDAMDEECIKSLSEAFYSCGIPFDIRKAMNTIIVEGNNDVIRKAKQLVADYGYDVM